MNCKGILGWLFGHKYTSIYNTYYDEQLPNKASLDRATPMLVQSIKTITKKEIYLYSHCKRCGDKIYEK